ncbi:MAG: hypothetical protein JXQ75_17660 [Phycisphaerae bacterium]|nr:hypothetical protein [Phycisphaerae bacterium]
MMTAVIVLCTLALGPKEPPEHGTPDVLVQAYRERTRYSTAHFKYKVTVDWPNLATRVNIVEAWYVGDNAYLIDKGDEDGIRYRTAQAGEPMFRIKNACLPEKKILDRDANERWRLDGSDLIMDYSSNVNCVPHSDVRSFGLYPVDVQYQTPLEMLNVFNERKSDIEWRVGVEDGMHVVTCRYKSKSDTVAYHDYQWHIDPSRNYAITEVTATEVHRDGRQVLLAHLTSEYAMTDGRWWPKRSETYCPLTGHSYAVEYEHAEFDKPDHPRELKPEIMGVPIGVEVNSWDFADMDPPWGRYLGDGVVVHQSEWDDMKHLYDRGPWEAFVERQRSLGYGYFPAWWEDTEGELGLDGVAHKPDLWEAYVRRWILKHTSTELYEVEHPVDAKQVNAAWAVLKDCRQRAAPICERLRKELEEVEKVVRCGNAAEAKQNVPAGDGANHSPNADAGKVLAARKKKAELLKPNPDIEEIFSQLKKRLEALLRQEQATSQKTSTSPSATSAPAI